MAAGIDLHVSNQCTKFQRFSQAAGKANAPTTVEITVGMKEKMVAEAGEAPGVTEVASGGAGSREIGAAEVLDVASPDMMGG